MTHKFSRFLAGALLMVSAVAMLAASFDAEARRMGGGKSFGRQSSNVTQQRQAVQPPAAASNAQRSAAPAAAATGAAAGAAAKTGMSRFLGPLAGIAAGLGIAALLSHMGLGGALLEFLSSAILIAIVAFAVMYLIRRLRGGAATPATQSAGGMQRSNGNQQPQASPAWQTSMPPAAAPAPVAAAAEPQQAIDPSWFIPNDFDIGTFLANAKQQFVTIQGIWDKGNIEALSDYLTDDLIAEFRSQIEARQGQNQETEILLLNAELLGIEKVESGHLASVRYSGMLREAPGAEGFHFEEVWNLYKADGQGWLLAGIQQVSGQASH